MRIRFEISNENIFRFRNYDPFLPSSIDGTSFSSSFALFCFRNEETLSADIMLLPVHALWHGGPTLSVSRRTCSKAIGAANTGGAGYSRLAHRSIDGNLSSFSVLSFYAFFFSGGRYTGLLAKRTNRRISWNISEEILFFFSPSFLSLITTIQFCIWR